MASIFDLDPTEPTNSQKKEPRLEINIEGLRTKEALDEIVKAIYALEDRIIRNDKPSLNLVKPSITEVKPSKTKYFCKRCQKTWESWSPNPTCCGKCKSPNWRTSK